MHACMHADITSTHGRHTILVMVHVGSIRSVSASPRCCHDWGQFPGVLSRLQPLGLTRSVLGGSYVQRDCQWQVHTRRRRKTPLVVPDWCLLQLKLIPAFCRVFWRHFDGSRAVPMFMETKESYIVAFEADPNGNVWARANRRVPDDNSLKNFPLTKRTSRNSPWAGWCPSPHRSALSSSLSSVLLMLPSCNIWTFQSLAKKKCHFCILLSCLLHVNCIPLYLLYVGRPKARQWSPYDSNLELRRTHWSSKPVMSVTCGW